jgi:ComF family protein
MLLELSTSNPALLTYPSVLIPIPMPRLRRYIRGYNQAELFAEEISRQTGLPLYRDTVIRKHSPKRQVTLRTRTSRLTNQKGSFMVTKDVIGLCIIVIDDVTTTGSTVAEARKVLLSARAKSVTAITVAH